MTNPLILVAEAELYVPASGAAPGPLPHAAAPHAAISLAPRTLESTETLRVSDAGWRSAPGDAGGVIAYPALLTGSLDIDRAIVLDPTAQGRTSAAWGQLRLRNEGGALDATVATRNADARPVNVWYGRRTLANDARQYLADPTRAQLALILSGLGAGWSVQDDEATLALRDPGYWLERQLTGATFTGAGGLNGTSDMAGQRRPMVRGGTSGAPVKHITARAVTTSLIYQVSDAAITVQALYEGGDGAQIPFASNTTDLTSGSTPAGQYRTDIADGLYQLGSSPVRPITIDATGAFPSGATATTCGALARLFMVEDLALDVALLDVPSFDAIDAAWSHPAGFFIDGADAVEPAAVVSLILASANARLVPTRAGKLRAVMLRAPTAATVPVASFDPTTIIACAAASPGAPLSPPPFRWRVGYARTNTIVSSDLDPNVTAATREALATEWRTASSSNAAITAAYRRPSDPPIVPSVLLDATGAQALADVLRDLRCVQAGRRVYDVTLPLSLVLARDLGDWVRLTYPLPGLRAGALGQIVGETIRWEEGRATLSILA